MFCLKTEILCFILGYSHLIQGWSLWPFLNPPTASTERTLVMNCRVPYRFQCDNGDCISIHNVCDGTKDCSDASDETKQSCKNGSESCHTFSFYCKYGACVGDRTKRRIRCDKIVDCVDGSDEENCDSILVTHEHGWPYDPTDEFTNSIEKLCILPNHPRNGRFLYKSVETYVPKSNVSNFAVLSLQCDDGYRPMYNSSIICIDGEWVGGASRGNLCEQLCPSLGDPSFTATCKVNEKPIDCSEAVEGTTAVTKCVTYFKQDYDRPRMTCTDGVWTPHVGICYPECGKKRVNVKPTIIGGELAILGEYPWIVAVYDKNNNQICGGSLISRKHVLSAAHCFTDSHGRPYDKTGYSITAGKHFRQYDDDRDVAARQTRKIHKFYVYQHYRGYDSHFIHDIIIVEVSKTFRLSASVQPVCVDWNNVHESENFRDGNEGVVGGWGFTTDSDTPAESLKKIIVPYRNNEKCEESLDKDYYERYFTFDKICGGYHQNGSNVCSGDSGGGYYFRSSSTFYVRGIVSSVQPTKAAICDQNTFAVYTKVSAYLSWLEDVTGKYL